jgi:hypothetical protein
MSESSTAENIDELEDESVGESPAQDTDKIEVPDSVKPVGLNRFGVAGEKRNEFVVNCKQGTDPKCVLETEFWEHIARHLGRGDIVEVTPDDLAWEMNVRIIDRGNNWALVRERFFLDYGGPAFIQSELPQKYKVEWAGLTHKFRVVFNGEILKKGFATEALAGQYATNHAQALKR